MSTWLTQIAINRCRQYQRRQQVKSKWLRWTTNNHRPNDADVSSDALIEQERSDQVQQAIKTLPASHREVIVLHYLEQMKTQEIAELLHESRQAVAARLHRARKQLRGILKTELER